MESLLAGVGLFSGIAFIYGLFRPEGVLPRAFGEPRRWKVIAVYLPLMGVSDAALDGVQSDGAPETAVAYALTVADSTALASAVVRRDSLLAAWETAAEAAPDSGSASVVAEAVRAEAASLEADVAAIPAVKAGGGVPPDTLAAPLYALAARSSGRARELGMLQRARALPASDLEGNRRAYAALASAYPEEPTYAERRDTYAQRIRDREARERATALRRSFSGGPSRSGACCRRCSRGKPCGDSCISRSYTCRQPPGCAC